MNVLAKNKKKILISAVIACYNDAQAIPVMYERLLKTFKKIKCKYEIIFVNDGSPDNTTEVLEKICSEDKNVKAIIHSRNFSSQNAFTSGMIKSSGDAVVLMDGDLQDPPELIIDFYSEWKKGNDVVYGIRHNREASRILNFFYRLFYRIFNKISYVNIPLDAGDFSLMDRQVVDAINSIPETERFIRGLRAWVGFSQIGVPYKRPERMFGKSTNNFRRNINWAKKGIFSFSFVPLEIISYLSYVVVLFSFIAISYYTFYYFYMQTAPQGWTTITLLILFLGGIQLLSLSFISEYIGKILDETKKRPKYIIKRTINLKK